MVTFQQILETAPPVCNYVIIDHPRIKSHTSRTQRNPTNIVPWDGFKEAVTSFRSNSRVEDSQFTHGPHYFSPSNLEMTSESAFQTLFFMNVISVVVHFGRLLPFLLKASIEPAGSKIDLAVKGRSELIGEMKPYDNIWVGYHDIVSSWPEERQDYEKSPLARAIRQMFGYMYEAEREYGFISVYEITWFFRRSMSNASVLEVSPAMYIGETGPTVAQCIWYIINQQERIIEIPSSSSDEKKIGIHNSGPTFSEESDGSNQERSDPNDVTYEPSDRTGTSSDESNVSSFLSTDSSSSNPDVTTPGKRGKYYNDSTLILPNISRDFAIDDRSSHPIIRLKSKIIGDKYYTGIVLSSEKENTPANDLMKHLRAAMKIQGSNAPKIESIGIIEYFPCIVIDSEWKLIEDRETIPQIQKVAALDLLRTLHKERLTFKAFEGFFLINRSSGKICLFPLYIYQLADSGKKSFKRVQAENASELNEFLYGRKI